MLNLDIENWSIGDTDYVYWKQTTCCNVQFISQSIAGTLNTLDPTSMLNVPSTHYIGIGAWAMAVKLTSIGMHQNASQNIFKTFSAENTTLHREHSIILRTSGNTDIMHSTVSFYRLFVNFDSLYPGKTSPLELAECVLYIL